MLFDCILSPSYQEVQVSSHLTLDDWWGDRLPRTGGGEQRQAGQASEDRKPPHRGSNMKHWDQGTGTTFHICSIMWLIIPGAPLPSPKDTAESGLQMHGQAFSDSVYVVLLTSEMDNKKEMRWI